MTGTRKIDSALNSESAVNQYPILAKPYIVIPLLVLAMIRITGAGAILPTRENRWDFSHYYLSALVLREGGDPYRTDLTPLGHQLGLQTDEINRATYPPTFLLCFAPLTRLAPRPAYWVWFAINLGALVLSLAMLLGPGSGIPRRLVPSLAALAVFYSPLWFHFYFAQSQLIILVILIFTMRACRREAHRTAGLLIAAAALLRVFPGVVAGYFIVRRDWRALAWTILGGAVGGLATLAIVGVHRSLGFLDAIGLVESQVWLGIPGNIAFRAVVERVFAFAAGANSGAGLGLAQDAVFVIGEAALLGATVWATIAPAGAPDPDARAFSLWVAAAIILAPTAWLHYLVLLYLPMACLIAAAAAGRTSRRAIAGMIVSYGILTVAPIVLPVARSRLSLVAMTALRESVFLGLLAAFIALYWFAADEPARSPTAQRDAEAKQRSGIA
jgi:hypothetical protein